MWPIEEELFGRLPSIAALLRKGSYLTRTENAELNRVLEDERKDDEACMHHVREMISSVYPERGYTI